MSEGLGGYRPEPGYRGPSAVRLEADEVAFRVASGVDEAIEMARTPSMDVIANYTAFQQIRAALGRVG